MTYQLVTTLHGAMPQVQRPEFAPDVGYAVCGMAADYRNGVFKAESFHTTIPSDVDSARLLSGSAVDACYKHDVLEMLWADGCEITRGRKTRAPASITACIFPAEYYLCHKDEAVMSVLSRNQNRSVRVTSYPLHNDRANIFFTGISPSYKIGLKGELQSQIRTRIIEVNRLLEDQPDKDTLVEYIAGNNNQGRHNLHVCFSELAKELISDMGGDLGASCNRDARLAAEIAAMYHKDMHPAFGQLIIL